MAELQENELTDVALCYQSMGIPLDASPAVIEQTFRTLAEDFKKKLASPDPAIREEAKASLELMEEMYQKIRSSITYHAMAKEHEKRAANAPTPAKPAARPVHKVVAEKRLMINCPRCNGSVMKGAKVCPVCKSPILSLPQRIVKELFTPKKIILYCVVLALVSVVALRVMRPELFANLKLGGTAQETKSPAAPAPAAAQ